MQPKPELYSSHYAEWFKDTWNADTRSAVSPARRWVRLPPAPLTPSYGTY
jgi:hypothetical protein